MKQVEEDLNGNFFVTPSSLAAYQDKVRYNSENTKKAGGTRAPFVGNKAPPLQ